jgi:hypothetical protein
VKSAARHDGNVYDRRSLPENDLHFSCRIDRQNLATLKDAKQTVLRPPANFVYRQGLPQLVSSRLKISIANYSNDD